MVTNRHRIPASNEIELIGRPTRQRTKVLQALRAAGGLVSAQGLHKALVANSARVGLSTVYRTLTALAEAGRADVVRDRNGERLFRYRPGPAHRHYLRCTVCGRSVPVDSAAVEAWAERIGRTSGFANVRHTVELSGVCPDCGADPEPRPTTEGA